jgi:hypothetical protein
VRLSNNRLALHRRSALPRIAAVAVALSLVALSGCADISRPDWLTPGTARQQRTRAQRFDPYPDPNVVHDDGSARPRDYLQPPPEADRNARSARGEALPDRWQANGP